MPFKLWPAARILVAAVCRHTCGPTVSLRPVARVWYDEIEPVKGKSGLGKS